MAKYSYYYGDGGEREKERDKKGYRENVTERIGLNYHLFYTRLMYNIGDLYHVLPLIVEIQQNMHQNTHNYTKFVD